VAGGHHAGVADEGALADLDVVDPHPAATELVGGDHGVVGEEGAISYSAKGFLTRVPYSIGLLDKQPELLQILVLTVVVTLLILKLIIDLLLKTINLKR